MEKTTKLQEAPGLSELVSAVRRDLCEVHNVTQDAACHALIHAVIDKIDAALVVQP